MRKYALLVILLLSPLMIGWTFWWNPVTTYTDGSTITRPVTYTVWDNTAGPTPMATALTGAAYPLSGVGSNVLHRYQVSAVVDNVLSARMEVAWTSPPLSPNPPAAGGVAP